jgi:hypothetical protein
MENSPLRYHNGICTIASIHQQMQDDKKKGAGHLSGVQEYLKIKITKLPL